MKQYQASESLPVGLLLALTGGMLDAYSYLNRGEVFATAETGNIVLLGINLAKQKWHVALHYVIPILAFTAGVIVTDYIRYRLGSRTGRIHWRQPLILVECLAVFVVSFLPKGEMDTLSNVIISFTSALQVEAFRKFKGCPSTTTMSTGNLRSGTEHLFIWIVNREKIALDKVKVYYSLILSFITGAILSGLLTPFFKEKTAIFTCFPLLIAFFIMLNTHTQN